MGPARRHVGDAENRGDDRPIAQPGQILRRELDARARARRETALPREVRSLAPVDRRLDRDRDTGAESACKRRVLDLARPPLREKKLLVGDHPLEEIRPPVRPVAIVTSRARPGGSAEAGSNDQNEAGPYPASPFPSEPHAASRRTREIRVENRVPRPRECGVCPADQSGGTASARSRTVTDFLPA